jgi:hypothetical protein
MFVKEMPNPAWDKDKKTNTIYSERRTQGAVGRGIGSNPEPKGPDIGAAPLPPGSKRNIVLRAKVASPNSIKVVRIYKGKPLTNGNVPSGTRYAYFKKRKKNFSDKA